LVNNKKIESHLTQPQLGTIKQGNLYENLYSAS